MRILTRDMGVVDVTPGQVLDFVAPILGFESCRQYALLSVPEAPPFHWLQSVERPGLAFPVVPAEELMVRYTVEADARRRLHAAAQEALRCWVIVALRSDGTPIRLNLRAPVVMNPVRRLAAQVVMREGYPVNGTLESCRSLAPALAG